MKKSKLFAVISGGTELKAHELVEMLSKNVEGYEINQLHDLQKLSIKIFCDTTEQVMEVYNSLSSVNYIKITAL